MAKIIVKLKDRGTIFYVQAQKIAITGEKEVEVEECSEVSVALKQGFLVLVKSAKVDETKSPEKLNSEEKSPETPIEEIAPIKKSKK